MLDRLRITNRARIYESEVKSSNYPFAISIFYSPFVSTGESGQTKLVNKASLR